VNAARKIELHVHLEGTIRALTLLRLARRNGITLPTDTVEGVRKLYQYRDFAHFIEVWILTTNVLRTADDFRQVLVDYAREATRHNAVYLEAIFSPRERVARGVSWETIFSGYCDGVVQAEEECGVVVRLTPDVDRGASDDEACEVARWAVRFRDRGVVGLGLGGAETAAPAAQYLSAFQLARDSGLGCVPHTGEICGPESIRDVLDVLGPDRIRHGIRAVEDPGLVRELVDRKVVLDVTPTSNVRTRAVPSLQAHPLPRLVEAGVLCSISTDDPAMFDTDLSHEYALAGAMGVDPAMAFAAGLEGAACDQATKERIMAAYNLTPREGSERPLPPAERS
jgi:aminodeoxyfutalosine deaminase